MDSSAKPKTRTYVGLCVVFGLITSAMILTASPRILSLNTGYHSKLDVNSGNIADDSNKDASHTELKKDIKAENHNTLEQKSSTAVSQ